MGTNDEVRALLAAQQAEHSARAAELEADLAALTAVRQGESDDDEHDPEGVTLSSEWSMLSALLESARDKARQADDAIVRLENGTYGICADCGQPIPVEQLEVRPFRESCVSCASKKPA